MLYLGGSVHADQEHAETRRFREETRKSKTRDVLWTLGKESGSTFCICFHASETQTENKPNRVSSHWATVRKGAIRNSP